MLKVCIFIFRESLFWKLFDCSREILISVFREEKKGGRTTGREDQEEKERRRMNISSIQFQVWLYYFIIFELTKICKMWTF